MASKIFEASLKRFEMNKKPLMNKRAKLVEKFKKIAEEFDSEIKAIDAQLVAVDQAIETFKAANAESTPVVEEVTVEEVSGFDMPMDGGAMEDPFLPENDAPTTL